MTEISYATPVDAKKLPFKDRRVSLRVAGIVLILLGAASGCFSILTPVGMMMSVWFQPPAAAARAPVAMPVQTAEPLTAPASTQASAGSTAPATPVAGTVETPTVPAASPGPATAPATYPATVALPPATAVGRRPLVPRAGVDYRTMVFALLMYVLATVLFIWSGVGALRVRRWVRPVMLIVAWTWLVSGVISTLYWALATPSLREIMDSATPPGAARPPAAVYLAMAWGTGTIMTLFMVVVPAVFAWVFGRKGVRETLEFFDPRTRWTEACPTPVLAVSAWLAAAAVACVLYCAYAVLPLFGLVVSGAPAVAGLLLLAAVYVALAWLTFRLRPAGWWGTLVVYSVWAASMVWTFSHIGWYEFYVKAGYTPQQVDELLRFSGSYENGSVWMVAAWSVLLIGYLLYVRKYFARAGTPATPAALHLSPRSPGES